MELELEQPAMLIVPRCRLPPLPHLEQLRENARISGGHTGMCVRCDRCDRRIEAPVSNRWLLRMTEANYQHSIPAPSSIRSREGEPRMTTIRASPKLCPGYIDGSCLALKTSEYTQTWKQFKSLPGVYKTDREWLRLGYPPAAGYSADPGWQDRLKVAARSMPDLTLPYVRYLSWRFAWHLFWHHRGMRHENAPLERMWGNVAADVLLWHFGLLQDYDLEALYCTSLGSLVGLLACRWDYGIAVLEMFYAIRQDLDKHGFDPLKSAVQRTDTAMRRYIKASFKEDYEEQGYQRMLLKSAFRVVNNKLRVYATEEQYRLFAKLQRNPPRIPKETLSLFSQDRFDEEIEEEPGELAREWANKSIKWLMHHIAEHEAIHGTIEPRDAMTPYDLDMSRVEEAQRWFGHEFIEELTSFVQEREGSEDSGISATQ
ncbi:hypothetical protein LZ30DRAFT_221150 [Colletotrichum cereale]|nr:hypothetical protein LZ30DRAFT_221150 [Colletotrichum cereale]